MIGTDKGELLAGKIEKDSKITIVSSSHYRGSILGLSTNEK
jgi:hypothetical protein